MQEKGNDSMKKILAMVLSLVVLSSGTWVYAASDGAVEDVEEGRGSGQAFH